MRRVFGMMMCAGLLVTGAAGCSDDDEKKADSKVAAYCDAVDDYVAKVKAAAGDAAKAAALAEDAQELSKQVGDLGTAKLSEADAKALSDCTQKSTEALAPG